MSDDEDAPLPGELQKAKSLPKLNVIYENIGDHEAHPGHRYLTPQPTKRKPFIAPKPAQNGSLRRSFHRSNAFHEDIPEHESEDSPELDSDDSEEAPSTIDKGRVRGSGSKNERLEEAKRDLVASCGPLTPKRVAPTPPGGARRKAPRPPSNRNRKGRRNSESTAQDVRQFRRPIRTSRDILNRSDAIDQPGSPDEFRTKQRLFYTPQPKRKTFNINRNQSFGAADDTQGSKSPVERLANVAKFNKFISRGSSGSSGDSTPSPNRLLTSPQFSMSSSPSPSPRSLTSSKTPSSSSSQHSSLSSTPSISSLKSYPISPLASPSLTVVTNTQKSPLSGGITWQTRPKSEEYASRGQLKRSNVRTRPQSSPDGPVCPRVSISKKGLRKTSVTKASLNRKGRRSRSTPTGSSSAIVSILKSPNRSMQPANAFENALRSENADPRAIRREKSIHDELLRSISVRSNIIPNEVNRTNSNMELNGIAANDRFSRQQSAMTETTEIDGPSFQRLQSEPTTPGSSSGIPTSPSSGYITPSPTSSQKNRPSLLRNMSSGSMAKSIFGSREVLNDLFRSDRGTNKSLKATAGFITGLILGVVLFVGLYYGLKYGLIAAIVITAVSTLIMALALAFTVRARCVALLMLPTLCTQRGRAAFLAIVVALLLNGPVNNIFINANEVSNSMSCSAELAYNQSQMIKEVAAEVFDQYVKNLEQSVDKLQGLAEGVRGVFKPVEDGLDAVQGGLAKIKNYAGDLSSICTKAAAEAKDNCNEATTEKIDDVGNQCDALLGESLVENLCKLFDGISLVTNTVCEGYGKAATTICEAPTFLETTLDTVTDELENIANQLTTNVDFVAYFGYRSNQSDTFENIQQAVEHEIDYAVYIINYIFSILDKLLALSVIFLLYRSYSYHTDYRTKDKFDNFYITKQFKHVDEDRKNKGKKSLLPLKKSERVRMIDVTSLRLCKPEKGLFKTGLVTLGAHVVFALLIVLMDNGLYWLLTIIKKHGYIKVETTGETQVKLEIEGDSVLSQFLKDVFVGGLDLQVNVSFDTTQCLPNGIAPNNYLSIGVAVCYFLVLLMVLFQAYALRLRRRIAAYFYPEREGERLHFLYTDTLRKRQTLFKFLRGMMQRKKKEHDATQRVSLRVFLANRYPCVKKTFSLLRIRTEIQYTTCFGCDSDNDGTFKQCHARGCTGLYCDECLRVTNNKCAICDERLEDIYDTIDDPPSSITTPL